MPVFLAMALVFTLPESYAIPATVLIVLLTILLIASVKEDTMIFRILTNSTVLFIGLISYSLYLWHWSVLSISRWTIGIHWWSAPFQLALMLALALVSYRFVEQPLRHAPWGMKRWHTIAYGFGASIGTACILLIVNALPSNILYTGQSPQLIARGVDTLLDPHRPQGSKTSWEGKPCLLADNSEVGKNIPADQCTLGDLQDSRRRILVAGDSYAAAFSHAFDELVDEGSHAVTITSSWGASPVAGLSNDGPWNLANDDYWKRIVPNLINQLNRGDWVLLVSDLHRYLPEKQTNESRRMISGLKNSLSQFSDQLAQKGIQLAILHANPLAREAQCEPSTAMKQWFSPFGGPAGACAMPDRNESLQRRSELDKALQSLRQQGKIKIVDLFSIFCPGDQCNYNSADGQILYRDSFGHPSVEAARLSAATFADVFLSDSPSPPESRPAGSGAGRSGQ